MRRSPHFKATRRHSEQTLLVAQWVSSFNHFGWQTVPKTSSQLLTMWYPGITECFRLRCRVVTSTCSPCCQGLARHGRQSRRHWHRLQIRVELTAFRWMICLKWWNGGRDDLSIDIQGVKARRDVSSQQHSLLNFPITWLKATCSIGEDFSLHFVSFHRDRLWSELKYRRAHRIRRPSFIEPH